MITMEPLQMSIKMELNHRTFYENASAESGSMLGRALFARLAREEDFHAAKANEIDDCLKSGENPLAIEESLDTGLKLRAIYSRYNGETDVKFSDSELELVQSAIEIEENGRLFYEQQSGNTSNAFERRYFEALQKEEQGHHQILLEYRDYLSSLESTN